MKDRIEYILKANGWEGRRVLVAVSGGVDSMVLADVLRRTNLELSLAHCNFHLRGEESDGDEQLVRKWAARNKVPLYVQHFDTRRVLESKGGNLQDTARTQRYQWFDALRRELNYDFIATAHHAQDSVETLLINLIKGTGISGLHGILPQQGYVIRPLLSFNRQDILKWAQEQQLEWREDSSNKKDNYIRNAIRHRIIPVLEEIVPGAVENLRKDTERFREAELLYDEAIEWYRKKLLERRGEDWYIPIRKLKNCHPLHTIMWELVQPFHFSPHQITDIVNIMYGESGRYVSSSTHHIIHNRDFLVITSKEATESAHILIEPETPEVQTRLFRLKIDKAACSEQSIQQAIAAGKNIAFIDLARLEFPLVLRPWKTGDYFYPIGMDMKKKKVSRFLISEKLGMHEKNKVWVLESNKKIVWVVGMRLDERFRLRANTKKYFKISCISY